MPLIYGFKTYYLPQINVFYLSKINNYKYLTPIQKNSLNQYTQRTVPGSVEITGEADPLAKIAIQQESLGQTGIFKPGRIGKYFYKSFTLDNSANFAEDTFNIFAVKYDPAQQKDIIAKEIRKLFVPKTPELYTYDLDGNLLSDGKFNYTWDAENRLISVTTKHTNDTKLEFSYDYMGRRVSKTVYSWVNNAWQVSKAEKYAWDGWNLIAEFTQSPSLQISKSYLWGEGGLIAVNTLNPTPSTFFPVYDGNLNIVAYVDASTGAKVAEYEYDAFGRCIVKSGVKSDDFSFRFSSYFFDSETGLVYYGYRYYNPETGRWLSRDPIQERGGNNLYGFVGNNAINKWDYLGMYPELPGHGHMISPEQSLKNIQQYQNAADSDFDKELENTLGIFRPWRSNLRNARRLAKIRENIGTNDKNTFVFTCKYGWIDMGHFFNNAWGTYRGSRAVAWTFSEYVEHDQASDPTDSSAWSPEDLVSNALGRDFGHNAWIKDVKNAALFDVNSPFSRTPRGMFDDISYSWSQLLKDAGAIKHNDMTKKALWKDIENYQKRPDDIKSNKAQRKEYKTVKEGMNYYREESHAWKCLCDGDKPRRSEDAY